MGRTALVIEAPSSALLRRLRSEFASDAALGVPPHVTVLYPFVPVERLDDVTIRTLRRVIGRIERFEYACERTGWFDEDVLWLAPLPAEPFRALTRAVCAEFPAYPPYGGRHDGPVPHATVGDSGTASALRAAEELLRDELPLRGSATEVVLLAQSDGGSWRPLRTFPLAPAAVGAAATGPRPDPDPSSA